MLTSNVPFSIKNFAKGSIDLKNIDFLLHQRKGGIVIGMDDIAKISIYFLILVDKISF